MNHHELRIMTFNLRNCRAADGANAWNLRRGLVVESIRAANPDLLGTQECFAEQFDDLKQALGNEYELLGAGRDDGKRAGEFAAMLVRRERFETIDSGTFWLSEEPRHIGGKGWDAGQSRIATFAWLRDRALSGNLLWLNTHFDDRGEIARLESAKLIRRWIDRHAGADPVILTGDFNADAESAPYQALRDRRPGPLQLIDAYRAAHPPDSAQDEGTFHGFTGKSHGQRIDWILCSPQWTPIQAEIDRFNRGGRYPSDHFPVTATLKMDRGN